MSLGSLNDHIAEGTIALIGVVLARGSRITSLSFDKRFNNETNNKFHKPLRDRGIPVVKDYRERETGTTDGYGSANFEDAAREASCDAYERVLPRRSRSRRLQPDRQVRTTRRGQHMSESVPSRPGLVLSTPDKAIGINITATDHLRKLLHSLARQHVDHLEPVCNHLED